jgi:hypothetical protein
LIRHEYLLATGDNLKSNAPHPFDSTERAANQGPCAMIIPEALELLKCSGRLAQRLPDRRFHKIVYGRTGGRALQAFVLVDLDELIEADDLGPIEFIGLENREFNRAAYRPRRRSRAGQCANGSAGNAGS